MGSPPYRGVEVGRGRREGVRRRRVLARRRQRRRRREVGAGGAGVRKHGVEVI